MNRLAVFAALVIATRSVFAEAETPAPRVSAGGGMVAAPSAPELQADPSDGAAGSCLYHFGSDMPPATFCVYRGVAFDGSGEVCATDVVAIWSSIAQQPAVSAHRAEQAVASDGGVYLAFVANPQLVVRAIADPQHGDYAEMVGYTLEGDEAARPLAGRMTLRALRGAGEVLSVDLRESPRGHSGGCAFVSYSGTFLGMIRPPSETTTSAGRSIVPRQ